MAASNPRRKVTSSSRQRNAKQLILASTSPFRVGLLEAAGIEFEAVASGVDEIAPADLSPKQIASYLAYLKAMTVSSWRPEAVVIGSDQTVELDGALLRKPRNRREAKRQLVAMAGRTHFLHTALAVCRQTPHVRRGAVASVKMAMRALSSREVDAYLDTEEWQGCAGSYRIEGQGVRLFDSIRGDFHAIVGLPLLRLLKMLRAIGVAI